MNGQTELIQVPEVETGDLESAGSDIVTRAENIPAVIPDDESYELCARIIIDAKDIQKRIQERVADEKQARFERHRMVCNLEAAMLAFPKKALEIAEPRRRAYEKEGERKRREAEAVAQAEANKQEEDKRLAEAEYIEALGDKGAAEKILEQPIEPPPVVFGRAVPKIAGLRDKPPTWAAHIFDLMVLVKAVAEGKLPLAAVLGIEPVDGRGGIYESSYWNQQAKATMKTQESFSVGPGVRAYDKNDVRLV